MLLYKPNCTVYYYRFHTLSLAYIYQLKHHGLVIRDIFTFHSPHHPVYGFNLFVQSLPASFY